MCVRVPQSNTRHIQGNTLKEGWICGTCPRSRKQKRPTQCCLKCMRQNKERSCPVAKKKDGHDCPSAGTGDDPVGWVVSSEVGRGRGSQDRLKKWEDCDGGDFLGSCQGSAVPISQV